MRETDALEVSLVVPVYNGERIIAPTLERLAGWLAGSGRSHELLAVDDGSSDGTAGVVEALRAQLPALRLLRQAANGGKGSAVRAGMLAARGRVRMFTDADLAYPVENLPAFVDAVLAGAPVVVADREHPQSTCRLESGREVGRAGRSVLSRIFRALTAGLGLSDAGDTQAGLKAFSAEAAERLFAVQHVPGFAFDIEVLYQARLARLPVRGLPVVYFHQRGRTPGQVVRDSLPMLCDLLRVRWLAARGRYDGARRAPAADAGARP